MIYHYVITVQYPIAQGRGIGTYTVGKTVTLPEGATRSDAFEQLMCELKKSLQVEHLDVLFFSLEPDALS